MHAENCSTNGCLPTAGKFTGHEGIHEMPDSHETNPPFATIKLIGYVISDSLSLHPLRISPDENVREVAPAARYVFVEPDNPRILAP